MQARHLVAALSVAAVSLISLLGCSAGAETAPPPSTTSVAATSTAASAARPTGLYPEWGAKFDAVTKGGGGPKCTQDRPKSQACMEYLTEIVTLTLGLQSEITARPDASSYVETLVQIEKVADASNAYAKCTTGCYADAMAIGLAPVNLMLRLQLDDPTQPR